jgi:hypothetical protein
MVRLKLIIAMLLALTAASRYAQGKALPVLQYVDGNGNSYEFTEDGSSYLLELVPVKKGNYSGGEPATRRVSKENYERVLARIDEAIKKKRLATTRERGTALIIKLVKGDFKEYILPKGSKDITEIEALLYTLF